MVGMSEKEFYNTSPRFFYHRMKGIERLQEIENNRFKWIMEAQRAAMTYAFNKNTERTYQLKPKDIFPLPWDEETPLPTLEEVKEWVKQTGNEKIPIDQF